MGLFASDEKKSAKRAEKLEEQKRKEREALQRVGLDLENYSDEDMQRLNIRNIKEVSSNLAGSGLYSFGSLLSGNSDITYVINGQKALIEQNWILIRQNEQIIRLLKEPR